MQSDTRSRGRAAATLGVLAMAGMLLVPAALFAQQPSQAGQPADQGQGQSGNALLKVPAVLNLATGEMLGSPSSPLHWGRFSVLSTDFYYDYTRNLLFARDNSNSDEFYGARSLIVYSIQRKRSTITLQYAPFVMASKRYYEASGSGQSIGFNTSFYPSKRWLLNIDDTYEYMPAQALMTGASYVQDFTSGLVTSQPFLAEGQNYQTNNTDVSLGRALGPRDRISIDSSFAWSDVSTLWNGNGSLQQNPLSATRNETLGAGLAWTHEWRPGRDFGLSYQFNRSFLNGGYPSSVFYSVLADYQQQIRPSLQLQVSLGPALTMSGPAATSTDRSVIATTTYEGSVNLLKTFQRSGISLYLGRSEGFNGLISNYLANQAYLAYRRDLGRRWNVSIGFGYIQQADFANQDVRGRDVWTILSYALSRSWSAVFSYTLINIAGGTRPVTGAQAATVGVQWSLRPARAAALDNWRQ